MSVIYLLSSLRIDNSISQMLLASGFVSGLSIIRETRRQGRKSLHV